MSKSGVTVETEALRPLRTELRCGSEAEPYGTVLLVIG